MSVELVRQEISQFLGRIEPEVLCIRGKWGVGKTYIWEKQLEAAQKAGKVGLQKYSYVSLFGVNTLDELKWAIFEDMISLNEGTKKDDLATSDSWDSKLKFWRKAVRHGPSLPWIKNIVSADMMLRGLFMTIGSQIICLDDIERRGRNLEVNDVMGLISYLREQRKCKVILILNDEQLGNNKDDFDKNLEKIVDISLVYEPSSKASADIAVGGTDPVSREVRDRCIALGISNIRVIRRICRFVAAVQPILKDYDPEVLKAAISSIALFSWSHDQPGQAPSLAFLKSKTMDGQSTDDVSPEEVAWNSLLEAYGYGYADDLDLALMKGVCDGYFDPERMESAAQILHDSIAAKKDEESFFEAWGRYSGSFEDNQDEVLDGIYDASRRSAANISPNNLNDAIKLFKDLERAAQAQELLDHYMEVNRKEGQRFFALAGYARDDRVDDEDIRTKFAARAAEAEMEETTDLAVIMMAINDGWKESQLIALAAASVEAYRKAFKSRSGQELREMLANVFQFDRIPDATDIMRQIPQKARAALKQIGAESPINARRVARFGVKVEAPAETPQ